jgi:hypothetical protein
MTVKPIHVITVGKKLAIYRDLFIRVHLFLIEVGVSAVVIRDDDS